MHRRLKRLSEIIDRAVPVAACALLLLLALPAHEARANMAARQPEARPGDRLGEPSGALKSIHIEREKLLIDARPLADGRPAIVEATYRVRNDGGAQTVELIFVAAALASEKDGGWVWRGSKWVNDAKAPQLSESGVWLDGNQVEAVSVEADAKGLPENWQPPTATPPVEMSRDKTLPYEVTNSGTMIFRVTIDSGPHLFRVRYAARPSGFCTPGSSAINWQLGYVLAPAREWASFGELEAEVLLPRGWRAASAPEMKRNGDTLAAVWREIPADALALTVQTHERTTSDVEKYWLTIIVVGMLLAPLAGLSGWKLGGWLGRRRRTSAWALLLSPVAATIAVVVAANGAEFVAAPLAPNQAVFNEVGNYNGLITFPLLVLVFFASFIVMQVVTFIARRRAFKFGSQHNPAA